MKSRVKGDCTRSADVSMGDDAARNIAALEALYRTVQPGKPCNCSKLWEEHGDAAWDIAAQAFPHVRNVVRSNSAAHAAPKLIMSVCARLRV